MYSRSSNSCSQSENHGYSENQRPLGVRRVSSVLRLRAETQFIAVAGKRTSPAVALEGRVTGSIREDIRDVQCVAHRASLEITVLLVHDAPFVQAPILRQAIGSVVGGEAVGSVLVMVAATVAVWRVLDESWLADGHFDSLGRQDARAGRLTCHESVLGSRAEAVGSVRASNLSSPAVALEVGVTSLVREAIRQRAGVRHVPGVQVTICIVHNAPFGSAPVIRLASCSQQGNSAGAFIIRMLVMVAATVAVRRILDEFRLACCLDLSLCRQDTWTRSSACHGNVHGCGAVTVGSVQALDRSNPRVTPEGHHVLSRLVREDVEPVCREAHLASLVLALLSVHNAPLHVAPIILLAKHFAGRCCRSTGALALVVGLHAVTIGCTSDPAFCRCVGG